MGSRNLGPSLRSKLLFWAVVAAIIALIVALTADDVGKAAGVTEVTAAVLKPLKCVDRYNKAGVVLSCTPDNAGPFTVRGRASTGYQIRWSVTCFDQNGENGLTARGSRIINGWFALAINRKSAPWAYRLMAEGIMCTIDLGFRAFKPNRPHSVSGIITWAHNLPTPFHD